MTELSFYFDESVDLAVSEQWALAGLDAVSAHSLDRLALTDPDHLQRAAAMGRVLCTCDADFVGLAQQGLEHAGIVFGHKQRVTIGDWVRYIRRLYATKSVQEVQGLVFFVERR